MGAVFSFDNFASRDTLVMTSPGTDDYYNCTIGIPDTTVGFSTIFMPLIILEGFTGLLHLQIH